MRKNLIAITAVLFLSGCFHHPRYAELLKENEQLKQQVELLKIQIGKEQEQMIIQAAQARYNARRAELSRAYCDSLMKAAIKKRK